MSKRRYGEDQTLLDDSSGGVEGTVWQLNGSAAPGGKRRKTGDASASLAETCLALESAVAAALRSASATSEKAMETLNRTLIELLTAQLKTNASGDLSAAARQYLKLIQQIHTKFTTARDASAGSAPPPLTFTFRPPQPRPPAFVFGLLKPTTPSSGFSFSGDAPASAAAPPASPSTFTFGIQPSSPPTQSFAFGSSSSPSASPPSIFGGRQPSSPATGFGFGASSSQMSFPVPFGQGSSSFGASSSSMSSSGTFGSFTQAQSSFDVARPLSPPPGITFGGPASPLTAFGSSSAVAASKPSTSFGSPAVSPTTSRRPWPPTSDTAGGFSLEPSAQPQQFSGFMAVPNTIFGVWNEPTLLRRRVLDSDIKPLKQISTGGFGDVWLSEFQGRRVAVKRLATSEQTKAASVVFAAEIQQMTELQHPRITAFVGVEWTKEWAAQALSEYEELGDLRTMVETLTDASSSSSSSSSTSSSLGWADFKCQAAIDVADALAYLHTRSPPVIMEVLRARNVLVSNMDGRCKLSVFAAARCRSVSDNLTSRVATTPWLAPEIILDTASKNERSVVYSFGALLCELDSGTDPLSDARNPGGSVMSSFKVAQQVAQGKLTPRVTSECPSSIGELARECLSFDAVKRPTAASVAYRLREILKGEL